MLEKTKLNEFFKFCLTQFRTPLLFHPKEKCLNPF